jgi:hypothetical protein
MCCRRDPVYALPLTDLSPGVQYFRCANCGFVWATQNGGHLTSFAANRGPGNPPDIAAGALTTRHGYFTAYGETGSQGPQGLLATRQIDAPRRRYRGGDPARFTPCRCATPPS